MTRFFTTLFLLALSSAAFGQAAITITGAITDGRTGLPIANGLVAERGTTSAAFADSAGRYAIRVADSNAVLLFSAPGYDTLEQAAMREGPLDVALVASTTLADVVVTALGIRRERRALGYAVQQLDARDLAEVKAVNFLDNITSKVAGVTVVQGPTGVGSTSKITIRGESSFANNNPLFVVDGVPINNNTPFNVYNEAASGFQGVDFGNGAAEVNPDDVQSVTVLKGPAAAALYGTRASNGVVVITMKDGRAAKGLGISFNSTTTVDRPFRLPDFQNKFGQGNSGKFEYGNGLGGGVNDNISYSYGPALDQGIEIKQYDSPSPLPDGTVVRGGDVAVRGGAPITPTAFVSYPDNLKDFYRTGLTTINNLAIGSSGDMGAFRLSYTDLRSKSYIPGTGLDRKTVSGHFSFSPTERVQVTGSGSFVNTTSDNRPANGYGSENVNYSLVAWGARSLDYAPMKDIWQPGLTNVQQYSFNYTFFDNPYLTLTENTNSLDRNRLFGNVRALYRFTPKVSLAVRTGIDYSAEDRRFRRHFSSNRFVNGAYVEQDVFYRETNTDALLNYADKLGQDFTLDVSAGTNRLEQTATFQQVEAARLAQPAVFSLNNTAVPLQQYSFEAWKRINSVYGIAKLGFRNFLFVDITGRNDWSSALATPVSAENTAFFYPSVSASFVASSALHLPRAISFLQLRASYAQVGNDTDPYQTAGTFTSRTPYASQPTLSEQNSIAASALLPENKSSVEVGGDIRFFRDRVALDVTYFNARTVNQIIRLPISATSGFAQQVVNGATVRNRGFEIIGNVTPVRSRAFRWDATLNFSRYLSTVHDLPEGTTRLTLGYNRVYDNINQTVYVQVEEGGRIGDLYGTGYRKNEDGRFIVDTSGNFIADNTLKKLGNYNPDFMLGFTNRFSYRNFHFGFLLDWRQGGILVSRTLALAGVAGQLIETENRPAEGIVVDGVVNRGTADNPVYVKNTKSITAESYYRQFYDRNHEENNTYDASFVKLRQVSLGYSFSGEMLSRSFLRGVRGIELSLVGRNLFSIDHTRHFDPEQIAAQGTGFVSGVEDMSYPTTRSYGFRIGLNL